MTSKFDLARVVAEADPGSEGFSHALNLVVLAIRRTNPAVGPLLDEFTSMHADYLEQLRELPRESEEHARVVAQFQAAAREVYQRLSDLQAEQAAMRAEPGFAFAGASRLH